MRSVSIVCNNILVLLGSLLGGCKGQRPPEPRTPQSTPAVAFVAVVDAAPQVVPLDAGAYASNESWQEVWRSGTEPRQTESSSFGSFELKVSSEDHTEHCRMRFRFNDGATQELFDARGFCFGDWPGMNTIGASQSVGDLRFPLRSKSGVEYHLFEVASAGGGNALRGVEYWVVALRGDAAWWGSLKDSALWQNLSGASFADSPAGGVLVLEEPAEPQHTGIRHVISFGSVKTSVLKWRPSR